MSCIERECTRCGHFDTLLPAKKQNICPVCGGRMIIDFDEYMDHDQSYKIEESYENDSYLEE